MSESYCNDCIYCDGKRKFHCPKCSIAIKKLTASGKYLRPLGCVENNYKQPISK